MNSVSTHRNGKKSFALQPLNLDSKYGRFRRTPATAKYKVHMYGHITTRHAPSSDDKTLEEGHHTCHEGSSSEPVESLDDEDGWSVNTISMCV